MDRSRLIEGAVADDRHDRPDEEVAFLQAEVRRLEGELRDARRTIALGEAANRQAITALRKTLTPLYRGLQQVFGEMDEIAGDSAEASTETVGGHVHDSRTQQIYTQWKSRLSPGCGKIIDALLMQRELNTQQLAIATGIHRNSIPNMIVILNKAGLLNKNGNKFSLKSLS